MTGAISDLHKKGFRLISQFDGWLSRLRLRESRRKGTLITLRWNRCDRQATPLSYRFSSLAAISPISSSSDCGPCVISRATSESFYIQWYSWLWAPLANFFPGNSFDMSTNQSTSLNVSSVLTRLAPWEEKCFFDQQLPFFGIEGDLLRLNVEPAFFVSKPEPICTSLERSLPEFDFKVNIDTEARFEFGLLDLGSSRVKGIMGICEGCRR